MFAGLFKKNDNSKLDVSSKDTDLYGIEPTSKSSPFSDFMGSNTLVSNFVFILLLVIFLIILFQILVSLVNYWGSPSSHVKLITGKVEANPGDFKINQGPNEPKNIMFPDKYKYPWFLNYDITEKGMQFTWSFWIYIEDLTFKSGEMKNVWVKGDNEYYDKESSEEEPQTDSGSGPNNIENESFKNRINGPGVYIAPNSNELIFVFNTYNNIFEKFRMDNITTKKWLNIVMVSKDREVDIFVNSNFAKRFLLTSLPKLNYNNIYIGKNGGFNGFVSNLWYWSYALGTAEIDNIYKGGPSTQYLNPPTSTKSIDSSSNYLSYTWYTNA